MTVSFMVTNGGPHPPEKWADTTTRAICDLIVIEPSAPAQAVIDKRAFETALFGLLVTLHRQAQADERASVGMGGDALLSPIDAAPRAASAVDQVAALAAGTPFAAHFAKPEVQLFVRNSVGQHLADSMHVERCWHADRNPNDAASKAFRAKSLR